MLDALQGAADAETILSDGSKGAGGLRGGGIQHERGNFGGVDIGLFVAFADGEFLLGRIETFDLT